MMLAAENAKGSNFLKNLSVGELYPLGADRFFEHGSDGSIEIIKVCHPVCII